MTKIINATCAICKKEKTGKMVFVNHHTDYEHDITILICRPCHNWLHGRPVYGHPFKKSGKDKAPFDFAWAVITAYTEAQNIYIEEWNKKVDDEKKDS